MKGKSIIRFAILMVFLPGFYGVAFAQDLNQATTVYNSALPLIKNDPGAAITSLKNCIDLCGKIGSTADSVKMAAQSKLPGAYFNLGTNQARNKEIVKAIDTFKEAVKLSQEFNTPEVLESSNSALVRLYYMQGNTLLVQKDLAGAQGFLDQAFALEPDNSTVWLVQSYLYKEANNDADFEKAIDKCISVSKNPNESKQAQQAGMKYFLGKGSKAVNGGKFAEGAGLIEKAVKYDTINKDAMFYLAKAYNGIENWDKAIEAANKGISIEEDVPEKEAKYYFELGNALKGKNDKPGACEAFKKAQFGQFAENAKYEIEVDLKCGK
jgi:tetratricopeptide (TPR) repeat protein